MTAIGVEYIELFHHRKRLSATLFDKSPVLYLKNWD